MERCTTNRLRNFCDLVRNSPWRKKKGKGSQGFPLTKIKIIQFWILAEEIVQKRSNHFFYENSLSIMLVGIFIVMLLAQFISGWHVYNALLAENGAKEIHFMAYLTSGHCWQATFENWESEFFKKYAYVVMTVYFKQKGSSESKPIKGSSPVDRAPKAHPGAPWPVKKGGFILKLYQNSLSLAFLLLFFLSFIFHAWGSYDFYKVEQSLKKDTYKSFVEYFLSSRFWFESFQNWQSEFLAVFSIVILSIFLRQKGSPESKPVDAAHSENE